MKKLEDINKELDLAIEEKRRQLLADKVSTSISEKLEPHLEVMSALLGGLTEKDSQGAIIEKLEELKDTLKNHEITIEI